MGVYYHFFLKNNSNVNDRKDGESLQKRTKIEDDKKYIQNVKVISGRMCCFVTRFDSMTNSEKVLYFKKVIDINGWYSSSTIFAAPDYYSNDVYEYSNGIITINNEKKDDFFD
jgi:hypothetical protein